MRHFLSTGEMLTPEVVAEKERFILPHLDVKGNEIPVVMGISLVTGMGEKRSMEQVKKHLTIFQEEKYVVTQCEFVWKGKDGET